MRFIGKWLIWIGGGALLYQYLRPLAEQCLRAYETGDSLGYTLEEWLMKFSMPVFVLGVICAAALPDLNRRRERKKKAVPLPPAPGLPADKTPPAAL